MVGCGMPHNLNRQASHERVYGGMGSLYEKGTYHYNNKDFQEAIQYYEEALEKERTNASLSREQLVRLITNLGVSYGSLGKLDKAKSVLEHGINIDSTYPMFYYNIACIFGQKGDLTNALSYLRQAKRYKANVYTRGWWPDPMKDTSFKEFHSNPEFLKFMQTIWSTEEI